MLVAPLVLTIIISALASSVSCLAINRDNLYGEGYARGSLEEFDGNKSKRGALSFAGQGFTNGVKAMTKLLDGAREVAPTNILRREYVKPGGVDRAMRDFYSVNPKNVQSISDKGILLGEVGDVSILFMKSGLDRKTKSSSLLIYKTDEKDLPFAYSNKIIYKS